MTPGRGCLPRAPGARGSREPRRSRRTLLAQTAQLHDSFGKGWRTGLEKTSSSPWLLGKGLAMARGALLQQLARSLAASWERDRGFPT